MLLRVGPQLCIRMLGGTLPRSASQASSGVLCCATSFSVMSRLRGAPFSPVQTNRALSVFPSHKARSPPLELEHIINSDLAAVQAQEARKRAGPTHTCKVRVRPAQPQPVHLAVPLL